MRSVRYYDKDGKLHIVQIDFSFNRYIIKLDGKYYTAVDDRIDVDDAIKELVAYRGFTVKRKKKKRLRVK